MDEKDPDPLPVGYRLGRYVIQSELPPAGMGRVYKAADASAGGVVAINVLAPQLRTAEGRERFFGCFRRAFAKRPTELHDYGELGDASFAVVAYIEGHGAAVDISTESEQPGTSLPERPGT